MNRVLVPAFAKINLGLEVLGRRADGYHEIRTVYQTISLSDTLQFEFPARRLSVACSAPDVPEGRANLVYRAATEFARAAGKRLGVRITLKKRIPSRAGLGGGSSDAAVTLVTLNAVCGRPLGRHRLAELAAQLGSDVPFFLLGGTALGLGRGEIVRPLREIEPCRIVLAVPDWRVSTAEAFRAVARSLTPKQGQISIYRFSRQWVRGSRGFTPAPNDLEGAVSSLQPRLSALLASMRSAGAAAAAMTGSGSAVFGLFAGERDAARAHKRLTGSSQVSRAWALRTVGAAEYAAKVLSLRRGHKGE